MTLDKINDTHIATQDNNFGIGNSEAQAVSDLNTKTCAHITKLKTYNGYRCPNCDKLFKK